MNARLSDAAVVTNRLKKSRLLCGALTLIAHLMVVLILLWPRAAHAPKPVRDSLLPLEVSLEVTRPTPAEPKTLQPAAMHAPSPRISLPKLAPSPFMVSDSSDLLSDSELAGASAAAETGSGGGGACDLASAVQQALRHDPMVRAAVKDAHRLSKAIMLWDGDWVRSGEQDGKGLSAVREAIMWEVAFAPLACRNMRMHGLVLLSLADGGTRFAVGTADWRWSDLLGVHEASRDPDGPH